MSTVIDQSPSLNRRKALREADKGVMKVTDTFPLERYYDATERLYDAFLEALYAKPSKLDDAYVYGIRFATFSIDSLPKHKCYKNMKYKALRQRNAQRLEEVLQKLESVTERMDAEELIKQQRQEDERKAREAEEKSRKQRQQREDEERKKRKEKEQRQKDERTEKARQKEIEESAIAKLAAMTQKCEQGDDAERETISNNPAQRKKEEVAREKKVKGVAIGTRQGKEGSERKIHEVAAIKKKADEEKAKRILMKGREHTQSIVGVETPSRMHRKHQRTKEKDHNEMVATDAQSKEVQSYDKPVGLRLEEERTIRLLQATIAKNEEHLKAIEEDRIPTLLLEAKSKLKAGERKEALSLVARKRRLDRHVGALKGGIFKMETQILRLESAAEDREVAKVMEAANTAMKALEVDMNGIDVDEMNRAMNELTEGVMSEQDFDEEELLSELDESTATTTSTYEKESEFSLPTLLQNILSLPSAPSTDMSSTKEKLAEEKPSGLMSLSLY